MQTRFYASSLDTLINEMIVRSTPLIADVFSGKIGLQESLGWFHVEDNCSPALLSEIQNIADEIRSEADVLVVVGVGGSNRAAQALINGLRLNRGQSPRILWAGCNFSAQYYEDLLQEIGDRSVYVNIIAKDFNTLEPGITFRMLRSALRERYGNDYKRRMILTGGFGKGQLDQLAAKEEFRFLPFPQRVGGRFSAFTPVGLLPMAAAGADIQRYVHAGCQTEAELKAMPYEENSAVRYATARHILAQRGFQVENLACFEPCMEDFGRWWLQLHAESEGKCPDAVLPMLTSFSEDLHAIGQQIQEGRPFIFETFLEVLSSCGRAIPEPDLSDGFDYLNGKSYDALNQALVSSVRDAHSRAGIPVLRFTGSAIDESLFGELFYTQMLSTYLSCALLGVEPFNQPGVEAYKQNLYRTLGKPAP